MKGRILFIAGASVGYVLGARAGHGRYEQISKASKTVWASAPVRAGRDEVKSLAGRYMPDVQGALADGIRAASRSLFGRKRTIVQAPSESARMPS